MSQWRVKAYRHSALFEITGRSMPLTSSDPDDDVHLTRERALDALSRKHDGAVETILSTDDMIVVMADVHDATGAGSRMIAAPMYGYRYVIERVK